MADVAKLYELQKTDLQWEKVKRRLLQLQKLLGDSEEIKAARQKVTALEAELHQWQTQQKGAELEAQGLLAKIKSGEERLMSGQVRNAKELDSLQTSINVLKKQRSEVDDKGMTAMLQADEARNQLTAQQKTLAQAETKERERHSELVEEENKLKRLFVQLKTHRAKLTTALAAPDVEQYEEMRRRKAGVAVASIEKGQCSGCNMRIPTGVVSAAHNTAQISYCPSCGRILHTSE